MRLRQTNEQRIKLMQSVKDGKYTVAQMLDKILKGESLDAPVVKSPAPAVTSPTVKSATLTSPAPAEEKAVPPRPAVVCQLITQLL